MQLSGTTGLNVTGDSTDSLIITGSLADINAALDGMTYTPVGNNPNDYDSLSATVTDLGHNSTLSSIQNTANISIGPDKANSETGTIDVTTPGNETTPLGTPLTFSAAGGNPITVNTIGLSGPVQLTVAVNYGTLRLGSTAGLTFSAGADDSSTMTISGTLAQLDAAFDGLTYTPGSNFVGIDTLNISNNPNLDYQSGGQLGIIVGQSTKGVSISAPATTNLATPSARVVFSPGNQNAISLAASGINPSTPVQLTLSVPAGSLGLGNTTGLSDVKGNDSSTVTVTAPLAELNSALSGLTYTPTAGDFGATQLEITTAVPTDASIPRTGTVVQIPVGLDVLPAALNVPPSQELTGASTPLVFSAANQNAISIADPAAGSQPVAVTLTVPSGTLTLGGTSGLSFTSGANGSASMTVTGTVASINGAGWPVVRPGRQPQWRQRPARHRAGRSKRRGTDDHDRRRHRAGTRNLQQSQRRQHCHPAGH